MVKTLKEIADELKVDKQKVYRFVKKHHIIEAENANGVMYYDEVAQTRIKQGFSENEPLQKSTSNDAIIDVLLKQSAMLERELAEKNEQLRQKDILIASLQRSNEVLTNSLTVAQNLHAGTIQKQLEDGKRRFKWKFGKKETANDD